MRQGPPPQDPAFRDPDPLTCAPVEPRPRGHPSYPLGSLGSADQYPRPAVSRHGRDSHAQHAGLLHGQAAWRHRARPCPAREAHRPHQGDPGPGRQVCAEAVLLQPVQSRWGGLARGAATGWTCLGGPGRKCLYFALQWGSGGLRALRSGIQHLDLARALLMQDLPGGAYLMHVAKGRTIGGC